MLFYYARTIVIVNIVFPALAVLAVLARVLSRRFNKLPLQIDDWVIIVALVVAVAHAISDVVAVYIFKYGELVTIPRGPDHYKWEYADGILVSFIIGIIKCSVILFYKRVFATRTFHKVANFVLLLCVGWLVGAVFAHIFQTTPISNYWTHNGAISIDYRLCYIALNISDLALDLVVLSLPVPMIHKLQISPKRRIAVMVVFGSGIFCIVASCARLHYFLQIPPNRTQTYFKNHPIVATDDNDAYNMWLDIECSASIITACLPTLAPFFIKMKSVATSAGNGWGRLIRSRSRSIHSSHSDETLRSENLPKNHEKDTLAKIDTEIPSGRIQAITVISVF